MARLSVIRLQLTPALEKLGWQELFQDEALVYARTDANCRHVLQLDAAVQLFAWSEVVRNGVVDYKQTAPFNVTEPSNMAALSAILSHLRRIHYGEASPVT